MLLRVRHPRRQGPGKAAKSASPQGVPLNHRLLVILLLNGALMTPGCGLAVRGVRDVVQSIDRSSRGPGQHGPLDAREKAWAKTAWRYFEVNRHPETGLVGTVDRHPTASMWQAGDVISALIAARELDLVTSKVFDERVSQLLQFLNTMPLAFGVAPNRAYHVTTGKAVDYAGKPEIMGWSAIETGRLLVWLKILRERHPRYAEYIDRIVGRLRLPQLVDGCGTLYAGTRAQGKMERFPEGRLGYLQYAAYGFDLWGVPVARSLRLVPVEVTRVLGIDLPHDARDPRATGVLAPVVTLPWTLLGLELDWGRTASRPSDPELISVAERVHRIQKARFEIEGALTARTDHPLSRSPWFVHDSIFASGYPWNVLTDAGEHRPELALVATRAAFGMWALWRGRFTDALVSNLEHAWGDRGFFEGRYERTGGYETAISSSTNAVVMEALLFKVQGALHRQSPNAPAMPKLELPDSCPAGSTT